MRDDTQSRKKRIPEHWNRRFTAVEERQRTVERRFTLIEKALSDARPDKWGFLLRRKLPPAGKPDMHWKERVNAMRAGAPDHLVIGRGTGARSAQLATFITQPSPGDGGSTERPVRRPVSAVVRSEDTPTQRPSRRPQTAITRTEHNRFSGEAAVQRGTSHREQVDSFVQQLRVLAAPVTQHGSVCIADICAILGEKSEYRSLALWLVDQPSDELPEVDLYEAARDFGTQYGVSRGQERHSASGIYARRICDGAARQNQAKNAGIRLNPRGLDDYNSRKKQQAAQAWEPAGESQVVEEGETSTQIGAQSQDSDYDAVVVQQGILGGIDGHIGPLENSRPHKLSIANAPEGLQGSAAFDSQKALSTREMQTAQTRRLSGPDMRRGLTKGKAFLERAQTHLNTVVGKMEKAVVAGTRKKFVRRSQKKHLQKTCMKMWQILQLRLYFAHFMFP